MQAVQHYLSMGKQLLSLHSCEHILQPEGDDPWVTRIKPQWDHDNKFLDWLHAQQIKIFFFVIPLTESSPANFSQPATAISSFHSLSTHFWGPVSEDRPLHCQAALL